MRAYNIQWDLKEDVEMYGEKECTCLPSEVIIPESVSQDIEDIDEIADFLSDEYGFCVISFDVDDRTETELRCPYCKGDFVAPCTNGLCRCMECGNDFSSNPKNK